MTNTQWMIALFAIVIATFIAGRMWNKDTRGALLWAALIVALGLLGIGVAQAGSATLTWTAPTLNDDGSPLTNLAGYRIRYGTAPTSLTQTVQVANASLTTYAIDNLAPGTWYFAMTAYTSTALESLPTNVVSKTIEAPPAGLVAQSADVYTLTKQRDRMTMVRVGSVAPGTACIPDQTANGYFAVPRASVTFSGSVRPEIVFADCTP